MSSPTLAALAVTRSCQSLPSFLAVVYLRRRPVLQRTVRPVVVVKPEIVPEAILRVPGRCVALRVHLLVFHRPPQPLHKYIVQRSAAPIHTDGHARGVQATRERLAGELHALVRVEDLRTPLRQRLFQTFP